MLRIIITGKDGEKKELLTALVTYDLNERGFQVKCVDDELVDFYGNEISQGNGEFSLSDMPETSVQIEMESPRMDREQNLLHQIEKLRYERNFFAFWAGAYWGEARRGGRPEFGQDHPCAVAGHSPEKCDLSCG